MGTIVAIGGIKNGIKDIKSICDKIIELSMKTNPTLLYIPTANNDNKEYSEYMTNFFECNYKCNIDTLWLIEQDINLDEIKEKILNSDIIFVEGGNLLKLLEMWKQYGINKILKQAYDNGIILSGISAGAICWFENAFSDSVPNKEFAFVKCLGFVNGYVCPHYNNERRKECFINEMKNNKADVIYGIEDDNAVIIIDDIAEKLK